ncbi:MAG: amidohydrolase family protein [Gemmatimonadota bacterium]|nr:amidohydrolase family protein [Gemmatimonadota bacterium]
MPTRLTILTLLVLTTTLRAQEPSASPGQRYPRLLIRNALVIDGTGNPVRGPMDILIEGATITRIAPSRQGEESRFFGDTGRARAADRVIDADGMYVMPGLIDMHGHIQFSRADRQMPKDYVYKLWLGHGITTIRDPGSGEGIDTVVAHARASAENRIAAPTIIPYATVAAATPEEALALVRRLKQRGAAGLKVFINRPDVWEAIAAEAKAQGLPIATDMKIQELDALGAARLGVRSIEHWYGIPDAAIAGPQDFPAGYNYDNELDRFRWAGDLWRQADSTRLSIVLDSMLARGVTWDPTFAIYEANRDLARARTQPWFADYALPAVMANFEPDPARHGSYFFDWTTADEIRWRENYRIWMRWVREYARRGGNVTVGSDAGFIYQLYGFTTIREMELHQEAGFHPLQVIRHATSNGAAALGLTSTGVVRAGFEADLAIVDGNPLHNLKLLYSTGVEVAEGGQIVRRGGVKYTIKDGIVFDAPALLADVREMVRRAKSETVAP